MDAVDKGYPFTPVEARRCVEESLFWAGADRADVEQPYALGDATPPAEAVLVMGAFDGLHLGHRALVAAALADAQRLKVPCIPVMFDPDPSEVLPSQNTQSQLLGCADRARGLKALGCDEPLVLPFTRELAALEPGEFLKGEILCRLQPLAIHVGSNFRFGRHAAGTVATLRELGTRYGFTVQESPLLECGGERVSSTRIRTLLASPGALAAATELLGRCHFVRGSIEHGRGEGTSFGFPTANVRCAPHSCMPAQGVYGGYVTIEGVAWPAAINVGAPVSFSDAEDVLFLEANLIGFSGDVYGKPAEVSFVEWLRPARRFDSLEELERVVLGNIDWVRQNLGERGVALA